MAHYIWVSRSKIAQDQQVRGPNGPGALFVLSGECDLGTETVVAESGGFLAPMANITTQTAAEVLIFGLTAEKPKRDVLACEAVTDLPHPRLLRLDEVSFPPGAIAYRHTHPGPGFRFLRHGALHLQADDHGFDAAPGQVWFEPAHSPVRATAGLDHAETRFVRFMVLPPAFQGKPTINILDPADAALPKRQSTHRHVDQVDAG